MFVKISDGKIIEYVVLDKDFWKNILTCLKGALSLIELLQLVDLDQKLGIIFIYEAMDQAKKICEMFSILSK